MSHRGIFSLKWTILFVLYFHNETNGSQIVMETSGDFTPMLTTTTSLRCSLNDSVGGPTSHSGLPIGRDASPSGGNIHIATITITRGQGIDVASITTYSTAQGFVDQEIMQTVGDISNQQGQGTGYLELTWSNPTKAQAENYTCEISGFSDTGHVVKFTKVLSLGALEPSIDILVQQIHGLSVENAALKGKVDLLKDNNQNLTSTIVKLENNIVSYNKENIEFKSQIANLTALEQNNSNEALQVETGNLECLIDSTAANPVIEETNTFKKKYEKPPIVYVSLYGSELILNDENVTRPEYYVELKRTTSDDFTVECFLHPDVYQEGALFYTWLALPSP